MALQRICVFCGSSSGARPVYAETAVALGRHLAASRIGVVYGGSKVGLMGILADTALAAGGEVIGVIPQSMVAKEIAHRGLTQLHIVNSMHERKAMMADLADAFIALPGGFGTFEEFCEILTWSQLGLHSKPCGLLNLAGYYDHLLALFDHAVAEQFLKPENRRMVIAATTPEPLVAQLQDYRPVAVDKWIGHAET